MQANGAERQKNDRLGKEKKERERRKNLTRVTAIYIERGVSLPELQGH